MLRIITLLVLCFSLSVMHAQCEYLNADFENWIDATSALDESGTIPANTALLPEDHTSSFRFFFMLFDIAFGTPGTPAYEAIFSNGLGLFPDTDADSGSTAMRIGGDFNYNFADVLTVFDCNAVPQSLSFSLKHVGNSNDTLAILSYATEGFGDLPQTPQDFQALPAYISGSIISDAPSQGFETWTLPYSDNELSMMNIDTFVNLFLVSGNQEFFDGGGESYFLIDNVVVNYEPSGLEELDGSDISIFPNPASDLLNIQSEYPVHVEIYDLTGQLHLSSPESLQTKTIDISNLNSGAHIVKIISPTGQSRYEKLIIR